MPRIRFEGENIEVPGQINGADLAKLLGVKEGEVPVKVKENGDYEHINPRSEYQIEDESSFDKVRMVTNG